MASLSKAQAQELVSLQAIKLNLRKSINALHKAGLDASELESNLRGVQSTIETF